MKLNVFKIIQSLTLAIGFLIASFSFVGDGESVKVKSAYLINFVQFIHWPNSKKDEITFGFLGESKLEDYLNKTKEFAEKRSKMKINVIHFNSSESVSNCDVLFCADSKVLKKNKLLVKRCIQENILTVTSKNLKFPDFSCINFINVNNKLRFEINNDVLKQFDLKASAQLLKLSYKR